MPLREEFKDIKEPYEKPEIVTEEIEIGVYGNYAVPGPVAPIVSCSIE